MSEPLPTDSCGDTTTNTHTYFFREAAALQVIRREVLEGAHGSSPLIWSAGCSVGCEPYSVAQLAAEVGASPQIIATDINPEALEFADAGRYNGRAVRYVRPAQLDRWFVWDDDVYRVRRRLRQMVSLQLHDVRTTVPRVGKRDGAMQFAAVLCRNVLIYLDPTGVQRAVTCLVRALAPGGLLFLGASEWLSSRLYGRVPGTEQLELVDFGDVIAYRRLPEGQRLAPISHMPLPSVPPLPRAKPPAPPPRVQTSAAPLGVEEYRRARDERLDRGDPGEALRLYQKALAKDDLLGDLHLRVGLCHLRQGEERAAQQALRRALFMEPRLWPAALLLGDLVAADDRLAAVRYFAQARDALLAGGTNDEAQARVWAPFITGRSAALEAVRIRLADLQNEGGRCARVQSSNNGLR